MPEAQALQQQLQRWVGQTINDQQLSAIRLEIETWYWERDCAVSVTIVPRATCAFGAGSWRCTTAVPGAVSGATLSRRPSCAANQLLASSMLLPTRSGTVCAEPAKAASMKSLRASAEAFVEK